MQNKMLSFPKEKIKIALLEKISPAAKQTFEESGFIVDEIPDALDGEDLSKLIEDVHILGVRSRTQVKRVNLERAKRLLAIGCYTVGTDQVELSAASDIGVPVFNAPHSSTRSVAELTFGLMVMLARKAGDRNTSLHNGRWIKSASGSHEIRGKSIGIIGYGHIGQQVGLIAEQFGMDVYFYDVLKKLPLGRAKALNAQDELLAKVDFVSLHVPGGANNENLITADEIKKFKSGAYLLNLSRGKVVDLTALKDALVEKKLAGAAIDVYPTEPASNDSEFEHELREAPNVFLTPHIGGSTEEAQRNIGIEVATSLINYIDNGSTMGAVNFPNINLPQMPDSHRILYIHKNEPGALSEVNKIISELGVNVDAQYLSTQENVGFLIMDLEKKLSEEVKSRISVLPKSIRTRVLY